MAGQDRTDRCPRPWIAAGGGQGRRDASGHGVLSMGGRVDWVSEAMARRVVANPSSANWQGPC